MSLKDNLEHKIGPLPAVAWVAIPAAGFLAFRYYKAHKEAATAVPTDSTGSVIGTPNTSTSSDLSDASDFTQGFTNSTPPTVTGDSVDSNGSYVAPTIMSNSDWARQAVNWLISQGINPVTATTALSAYVYSTGQALNDEQTAALNEALTHFGSPPEGVISPPPTTATPVVTPTTPASTTPKVDANTQRIQDIFTAHLGRTARADEIAAYQNTDSNTLSGVLDSFTDSLKNQNTTPLNTAGIQAIFMARMGRAARPDEVSAYLAAKYTGAQLKARLDSFPDSLHARGLL